MSKIGGVATVLGKTVSFPRNRGLGLVELDGRLALVRFACPIETMPPQGEGHVIASTDATLQLEDGRLTYKGDPVVFGSVMEDQG